MANWKGFKQESETIRIEFFKSSFFHPLSGILLTFEDIPYCHFSFLGGVVSRELSKRLPSFEQVYVPLKIKNLKLNRMMQMGYKQHGADQDPATPVFLAVTLVLKRVSVAVARCLFILRFIVD